MPDSKRPIAELVKRWEREIERLESLPNAMVPDPIVELLRGGLLELQAAIDEQIRMWDDIEGDFKCINDAFDRCISDLRGDNQGDQDDG